MSRLGITGILLEDFLDIPFRTQERDHLLTTDLGYLGRNRKLEWIGKRNRDETPHYADGDNAVFLAKFLIENLPSPLIDREAFHIERGHSIGLRLGDVQLMHRDMIIAQQHLIESATVKLGLYGT